MNNWKNVSGGDLFEEFLWSISKDGSLGNGRFIPRNFLLDEGVKDERKLSYADAGIVQQHADLQMWDGNHCRGYLRVHVFLPKLGASFPNVIDPSDSAACAETFRPSGAFDRFGKVADNLELVRVEQARTIADIAELDENLIIKVAQEYDQDRPSDEKKKKLNAVLDSWALKAESRPVWAVFWQDVYELFEPAQLDWADQLRDQLGLYHLDPVGRKKDIPVLIFKYPVSTLPQIKDRRDTKPLAVPTVLDGYFNQAFCPAPPGEPCGYVVNLSANDPVRREVLHPPVQFRAEHLYKVGWIKRGVPSDLSAARGYHLIWICAERGPADYAIETDGDLF